MFTTARVVTSVFVLTAGCGSGGASCPVPIDAPPAPDAGPLEPACTGTACGGDITGTWELYASCASGDGRLPMCQDSDLKWHSYVVRGTLAIDAQGNAMFDGTESGAGTVDVPLACFGFTECDQVQAGVTIAFGGGNVACHSQLAPGECEATATPTRCNCYGELSGRQTQFPASFATSGTAITMMLGEEVIAGEYCVSNDELWMKMLRWGTADVRWRFRRKL